MVILWGEIIIKKLSILLTVIICVLSVGWGRDVVYVTQEEYEQVQENKTRFQSTGNEYVVGEETWIEYVDIKTNNLYIQNKDNTYGGWDVYSLTPLYDENGNIAKYTK